MNVNLVSFMNVLNLVFVCMIIPLLILHDYYEMNTILKSKDTNKMKIEKIKGMIKGKLIALGFGLVAGISILLSFITGNLK